MSVFPPALYLAPAERPFAWLFISLRRWLGERGTPRTAAARVFASGAWSAVREPHLSYDGLRELAKQPNLANLKESVLEDYEEEAEE
jgi:hypothetical protein